MKRRTGPRSMSIESLESRQLLTAVKIMPLGDSITESFTGHATYRFFLYSQLVQAGYDVDFVGTHTGTADGSPLYTNFDQNNEGHSGWRADDIANNMVAFANANKPDIVLLHIGSNDIEQGQSNSSTITDISNIIDNLRSVVPNVKIILAKIIPESTRVDQYPLLNNMIATLASQKTTAQSPITLVDQYTGFNTSTDTFDGVHPNDAGERKLSAKFFTALTSILPAPTPPQVVYLSDLNPTSSTNGWGPIEKDRSNGETGASDGHTLALGSNGYLKGLGTHAGSDVTFNISGGSYTTFLADIGLDEEVGNAGSVVFQVYVNNSLVYTSPTLTGSSAPLSIPAISVAGASTLRLVVSTNGSADYDHADWANARLTVGQVVPPPLAPTALGASYNSSTGKIDLTWTDNASDETGFRIERKTGANGTYAQIAEIATANLQSYSDASNLVSGTTYYYRVTAYKTGAPASAYSNDANASVPILPGTYYISDLAYVVNSNGWGAAEKDKSNGEAGSNDGHTITLNGQTYTKGIGVHAASEIVVNLNGQYSTFFSDVGVDDETGNNGSVVFQVYLDGASVPIFDSGKMTGATATKSLGNGNGINVAGAQTLRLVVTTSGDGADYDHADWAGARLLAGQPVTPPGAPTDLSSVFNSSTNKIDLAWTDHASDEVGFRIDRKAGVNGVYAQIADLGPDVQSYSDGTNLVSGTTYYYRVYAYKVGANSSYSLEANATVPILPGTTKYLSDLAFTVNSNGWGQPEKDKSNGELGSNDGRTITLNTQTYTKGIGVHANSDLVFALNGQYSTFFSDMGLDDEVGNNGSVVFQVYLDGASVPIFDSGKMTGATATKSLGNGNGISVAGVQTLRLVVTNSGDGADFDHADWAGARLVT